jgi:CDP-6-deoxy-D-xylo-4-hexulose-3-dehydrase
LKNRLGSCEEFLQLPIATVGSDPSWFGFPITLRENCPVSRSDLLKYLDQNKIGSRMLFAGNLTCQPYMEEKKFRIHGTLENTNQIMNNTFWVGIFPGNTEEMLDFTASKISEFLGFGFE